VPKRKAPGRVSPKRQGATLSQRMRSELKVYARPIVAVMTILGILYFPRWVNIGVVVLTAAVVFATRADTTVLILKSLRSKGSLKASLYLASFLVAVGLIGTAAFIVGSQIGHTSGVREALRDLDLPAHPLPPPRPRSPGDVNLDEYCRSLGPYQVMAPGPLGLYIEVEGTPTVILPFTLPDLGPNDLICGTRPRQPNRGTVEFDHIVFVVDRACRWQYPGQKVKAIPPKDRRDIDQWRCNLTSGPPATWP
jgi:hypothetical protein